MKKGNAFRDISWNNTYIFLSLYDQSCFLHLHFSVSDDHILHQQRRLLSDWSVKSEISLVNPLKSCPFIRSAGRRLPLLWRIDGCFSSFKFLVCLCDHDTVWMKIAVFVNLFFMEERFSTERKIVGSQWSTMYKIW